MQASAASTNLVFVRKRRVGFMHEGAPILAPLQGAAIASSEPTASPTT